MRLLRAINRASHRVPDSPAGVALTFLVLIVCAGVATSHLRVRTAFYSAVAELIPVLLLVAVVRAGYFRDIDHRDRFRHHMSSWILSLVLAGEISALACIARGHDSLVLRSFVFLGLILAGLLVYFYAMHGSRRTQSESPDLLTAAEQVRQSSESRDSRPSPRR